MADWTTLIDSAVGVGGIPSGTTVTALRDNPVAIAERATGAPLVKGATQDFISRATISSDATVDFTAFDNSIYKAYRFIFKAIQTVSTPVNFEMLMSTDGGSTFQSSYAFRSLRADGGGITSPGSAIGSQISLVTGVQNTSGTPYGINGYLDLLSSDTAIRTSVHSHMLAQEVDGVTLFPLLQITDGWSNSATDTDAVRFQLSAGNMASGIIEMYGILDDLVV